MPDGLVHVRPSNTGPILRLTTEAMTRENADGPLERFLTESKEVAAAER